LESQQQVLTKLRDSIVNLDVEGVREASRKTLEAGIPPYKAISEGMAKGMEIIGRKFADGEYFLSELVMAGEVMKEGMAILEPHLKSDRTTRVAKVVIGTVKGDLHDIGKNIVTTLLRSAGFEVYDLGTDVPVEVFVNKIRETDADIVGMSALLSTTVVEMKNVVKTFRKLGLRQIKTIIGGAAVTERFAKEIGVDAFANDAIQGVTMCRRWAEEKQRVLDPVSLCPSKSF